MLSALVLVQALGDVPVAHAADASPEPTAPAGVEPSATPEPSPSADPAPTPTAPPADEQPAASQAPSPTPTPTREAAPTESPMPDVAPAPATHVDRELGVGDVVSLRTETSQTFDNGDGTFTTQFFSEPVFYQPDGVASFEKIEVGFEATSKVDPLVDEVPAASSDEAPAVVSLFDSSQDSFVTVAHDDHAIGFGLPAGSKDAVPSEPVTDGIAADYVDLWPGTDVRVLARPMGSKAFVVLHEIPETPSWTFTVDAPGLSLVARDDGTIDFVDAKGEAVAYIPHPYAVDSTLDEPRGGGEYTDKASLQLGEDADGTPTITISVDPDWLARATYPVYVDPTTVFRSTNNTFDAFTSSANSGTNFGVYQRPTSPNYYEMWLGLDPSGSAGTNYVYVQWDVSSIANSAIDAVTVGMHAYHQYYNAPTEVRSWIQRVNINSTNQWTESGIKWSNQPPVTGAGNIALIDSVEGSYATSNNTAGLRTAVQDWVSGTGGYNNGLRIWADGNGSTYWKRIVASEDSDVNKRISLNVDWHTQTVTDVTPKFTNAIDWDYGDSAGHAQAKYQVQVATSQANLLAGTTVAASGEVSSATTAWQITPGALTDLGLYWYRIRANDGAAWSTWSTPATFTYDAQRRGAEPFYARVPFDLGGGWAMDVGVHNGELGLSRSVYSVPTYGPAQGLELAYSSLSTTSGLFGYGWTSNLTQSLSVNGTTGLAIWTRADGGRVAFTGSGSTWTTVPGHFEKLTYNGSSEYTVTQTDQTKLIFASSGGKLLRILDRFGKTLSITWGATSATVTAANGQQTTLNYPGGTLITSVVDPALRTWTFGYTSSDLTTLTEPDPDGAGSLTAPLTTLAYASHDLNSITRARRTAAGGSENLVWSVGYTSGRATSVIDPIANASYAAVANTFTYGASSTTVGLLKTYSPVARNTTTYAFDALGRVTATTDPNGFVTKHTWNNPSSTLASLDTPVDATTWTRTAYTYDPAGNVLTEIADATGDPVTTRSVYNTSNDVTEIHVADGTLDEVVTTQAYDTAGTGATPGHLISVTANAADPDPAKREVTQYAYWPSDLLRAELDPKEITTTYAYDANGNEITTVVNCTNTGSTPPGDPAWKTCAASGAHDAATNVTTTTAFTLTSVPRKLGLPASTTNSLSGTTSTYSYDSLGRLSSVTAPEGMTTFEYDQLGNEVRTTAPGSLVTTRTLDLANRVITEVAPAQTTSYVYDAVGSVTSMTAGGDAIARTYDGAGNLTSETIDPGSAPHLNLTTEHAYDASGQETASRDPRGTVRRTWYDPFGRVTKVVENCTNAGTTILGDPAWKTCAGTGTKDGTWNLTTTSVYDDRGNLVTEAAPNGRVTTSVYDDLDRLIKRIDNDVASPTLPTDDITTEYAYDAAGNQTAVTAPGNSGTSVITIQQFDELGRVVKTIANCTNSGTTPPAAWQTCAGSGTPDAATNLITTYSYAADGRQLAVTSANPAASSPTDTSTTITRYAYDGAGRLCRVLENASVDLQTLADPCATTVTGSTSSNLSTRYTYDTRGNLATMVDARGNETAYGYDDGGRMTGLTNALGKSIAYEYDAAGRKVRETAYGTPPQATRVTWTYDAAGRMKDRTADGVTITYTYDANGNLLTASGPTGTITTTYDRLNRPLTVGASGDAGAATSFTYGLTSATRTDPTGSYAAALDKFGRQTSLTDPIHGATPFAWTYRADGQLASSAAPNGNTTAITYSNAGATATKTTTGTGGVNRAAYTWIYNRAGQVLSENSTIAGDPANGIVGYGYDQTGRLTAYTPPSGPATAYGWQEVPNRASVQTGANPDVTTTYDAANRPTSDSAGGSYSHDLDGRMTVRPGQRLDWDALGRLTAVRPPSGSSMIAAYTYDALDRLLLADYGTSRIRFRYVGTSTRVAQTVDDATSAVIRSIGNDFAGERLVDWTGTNSNQRFYGTNAHHDVTWTADGTGAVTATLRYDPWGVLLASSGTSLPDFRFQSSWYDTNTDLSWVITRWYAPAQGRFVSEDSLLGEPVDPSSQHLYAYAEANPIAGWDPDGRVCLVVGYALGLGGAVVATLSCIPDALVVIGGAITLATSAYAYLRSHPVQISWTMGKTTQLAAGKKFEAGQVKRLRQRYSGGWIQAPMSFWTPLGWRYLDACLYSDAYSFLADPNHPRHCWEIKSSASSANAYFNNRDLQYEKDKWLRSRYGFRISVIWTKCVNPRGIPSC